jgi:predicted transcriptional regulator
MKVMMPQELEVWYLIPAIRRELAKTMLREGLTQKRVAQKLGITEAAVSQYMKSKRAAELVFNENVKKEIDSASKRIINGGCVVKETKCICDLCRADLTLCKLHRKHGAPDENCRVCLQ